jgi:hypothetical protein
MFVSICKFKKYKVVRENVSISKIKNKINMIFGSKKKKTAKGIQQAISDIANDVNLRSKCSDMTNNKIAASYLFTEVMIQRINTLLFIIDIKFRKEYDWASWEFVYGNIKTALVSSFGNEDFYDLLMKGIVRLEEMGGTGHERLINKYKNSTELVKQHDNELNEENTTKFIEEDIKSFVLGLGKYF